VDVTFDDRRVGAKPIALGYSLLAGQADHPLMNLCGDRRTQQSKVAAEGREVRRNFGIEVGEAAVHQVAAELPLQIAEAPALQVFHDTAAQQTIGGDSVASGARGKGLAFGQTLADQVDQDGIVQELVDWVEQIVFE
jgi:hypothetical protein